MAAVEHVVEELEGVVDAAGGDEALGEVAVGDGGWGEVGRGGERPAGGEQRRRTWAARPVGAGAGEREERIRERLSYERRGEDKVFFLD